MYRQAGYIAKETVLWGNFYHDGNDYVYGGGIVDGQDATNGSRWHPNKRVR